MQIHFGVQYQILGDTMKYLPDTCALIDGIVSKMVEEGKIKGNILIHKAVISELEAQANRGEEIGIKGLEEIKKLREIADVVIVGEKPGEFEIKNAKHGEIDTMLIEEAKTANATFITLDLVAAKAAEAYGVNVIYIEREKPSKLKLEDFFDEDTMSVHLKEDVKPIAKKGKPGNWRFEIIREEPMKREELEETITELLEKAREMKGFVEIERRHSMIIQAGIYRIVVVKPPLSEGIEITAVRPLKKMKLEDYKLHKKILERIKERAEGIVISGSPGAGKSTFAEALAEYYMKMGKIVKTIETPRDMQLPPEVTQYSKSFGSNNEIRDILLLSRPDYTVFDEMRNPNDFDLYSDLRLTGIGMIGVVHASKPIDAIQRFINKVELGLIPSIVDTVIFIENGEVSKVYSLKMKIKVPRGMHDSDLARPVVEVVDAITGRVEYEIYTFGDQTNVIPVGNNLVEKIKRRLKHVEGVEIQGNKVIVYVERKNLKKIIGKNGRKISRLEKEIGMEIELVRA